MPPSPAILVGARTGFFILFGRPERGQNLSPENPSFIGLDAWVAGFYPHGLMNGIYIALKIIGATHQHATRTCFTRNTLDLGEPRDVRGVDAFRQRGVTPWPKPWRRR